MNVASLENCKELYELSGWIDIEATHTQATEDDEEISCPAYTLGYLLRKLPQESQVVKGHFQFGDGVRYHAHYSWNTELPNRKRHYATESADTPEDAAAKLAIELFKQGLLTKEVA